MGAYPAEFLRSENHSGFKTIQAFKGRGVLLELQWFGPVQDVHMEQALSGGSPGILYHIFGRVDTSGGATVGVPGTYWCSRIYPPTKSGLILVKASIREDPPSTEEADYGYVQDSTEVAEPEIVALNSLISNGIPIEVLGEAPNISGRAQSAARGELKAMVRRNPMRWILAKVFRH